MILPGYISCRIRACQTPQWVVWLDSTTKCNTVRFVPARIIQLLEWGARREQNEFCQTRQFKSSKLWLEECKKEWFENIQEYAKRTIYPLKGVPINMGTKWRLLYHLCSKRDYFVNIILYSETLNNEYIGRIYQMSSWQFFNEFYTILRKFKYNLRK